MSALQFHPVESELLEMKTEANSIHSKGKMMSFMPWFLRLLKLTGTILNGNFEECKRLEHIKSEAKEALALAGF